jgi:dethiobiotin synthetase
MRRIVLLGTGTGVGKTFVATRLVRELGALGLKPVETGCDHGRAADAEALGGVPPLHAFEEPLSPHLAARRARRQLEARELVAWVHENALRAASDMVIIETAGGVLTPLSETESNLDLARLLEPALLVLIAPDALGVLHDVRAATVAMDALHRRPDHVVLTLSRPRDASTGTNSAELERLGLGPVSDVDGLLALLSS